MKVFISTYLLLQILIPSLMLSQEVGGSIKDRIFNGQNAERGQFPYLVRQYQHFPTFASICGGSLLSDTWVLTAAHCAYGAIQVDLHFGIIDLPNNTGVFKSYASKENIYVHSGYNWTTWDYDVALLKSKDKVPFEKYPYVATIALPTESMMDVSYFNNYTAVIGGWGATNNAGNGPKILQWAKVHVMNHDQCKKATNYPITENMVCQDRLLASNVCGGDSGGPLATTTPDGVLRVIGAASWIIGNCEYIYSAQYAYPGSPGILPWIMNLTGIQPK